MYAFQHILLWVNFSPIPTCVYPVYYTSMCYTDYWKCISSINHISSVGWYYFYICTPNKTGFSGLLGNVFSSNMQKNLNNAASIFGTSFIFSISTSFVWVCFYNHFHKSELFLRCLFPEQCSDLTLLFHFSSSNRQGEYVMKRTT